MILNLLFNQNLIIMKRFNFILALASVAFASFVTSCSEETASAPEVSFSNGQNTAAAVNGSYEINGSVTSEVGLDKVVFLQVNGGDETTLATISTFDDDKNYVIKQVISDVVAETIIKVTATDKDGQITSKTFTITVGGSSTGDAIKSYSAVLLGAQDATTGSAYASVSNSVYTLALAKTNSASVDFVYFYGASNLATLAAPNDVTVGGTEGNLAICAEYATKNATKFSTSTVTASEFTAMTDDSVIATVSASDSKITQLATGSVVSFVTAAGKKGLIHIAEITTGATGSIKINVKVQE